MSSINRAELRRFFESTALTAITATKDADKNQDNRLSESEIKDYLDSELLGSPNRRANEALMVPVRVIGDLFGVIGGLFSGGSTNYDPLFRFKETASDFARAEYDFVATFLRTLNSHEERNQVQEAIELTISLIGIGFGERDGGEEAKRLGYELSEMGDLLRLLSKASMQHYDDNMPENGSL